MTILVVIPARGGSKGIPRKNLLDVGGQPLLAWTIQQALAARTGADPVSYTHLTLPTILRSCRSRWSPYH